MSRPTTLDLPENVSARRLETDRGSFAVLDAAPDRDAPARGTALLVPGFTGSKEDFLNLLVPLTAAGFRAVCVDGRGQYESGGPSGEEAYAQRELAADVIAQRDALAAAYGAERVHVLGHSMGGHVVRAAVLATGAGPWASLTLMSSGPAAISDELRPRTQAADRLPADHRHGDGLAGDARDGRGEQRAGGHPGLARRVSAPTLGDHRPRPTHRHSTSVDERNRSRGRTGRRTVAQARPVRRGGLRLAGAVAGRDGRTAGRQACGDQGRRALPNAERPAETAAALIGFWTTGAADDATGIGVGTGDAGEGTTAIGTAAGPDREAT